MDRAPPVAAQMPFRRIDTHAHGVRLSVVDDGPRDARETVLFLHGNPAWSFLWRNLMVPVLKDGHRVVAPDLAGFGMSEKPTDPDYYSLDRHVENVVHVMDDLDLHDVTLVLHDWGGPIGMGAAVERPARVKRIVIANTTAFPPQKARPLTKWHQAFASPLGFQAAVHLNAIALSAFRLGVNEKLSRPVRAAYLWPMREKGARVAAARFVQLVPDGPDHPTAKRLREINDAYPKLAGKPVLVLWADKDPVFRPKLAEKWLEANLHVIGVHHVSRDAGHFWQEDDPEAFLSPLRVFLATAPGKA